MGNVPAGSHRVNQLPVAARVYVVSVIIIGVVLFVVCAPRVDFHEPVLFLLRSIKGWPAPGIDPDLVVNSMWGLNYGIALDTLLRGGTVDVARTAERVTRLYAVGIPEFKKAKSAGVRR